MTPRNCLEGLGLRLLSSPRLWPEARIRGWMTLTKILVPICFYCLKCTKFGQLILRKIIIKIVATRCQILRQKCTKFYFGWGSAPDPAGGAYSASPDPLAGFKGPISKGREGRGERGKEGRGGEGERKGQGRGGEYNVSSPLLVGNASHGQMHPPL